MKDLSFTIWVTNDCNLLCDYCYVHKKIDYMSEETAKAVIEFIKNKNVELKPDKIKVVFSGGEPLMNFGIVQSIVSALDELRTDASVIYMITTNGTIYPSEEQMENLKKMSVSVSLDGNKNWNDAARKYKNSDMGSYENAVKTIDKMTRSGMPVRIRMTVIPDNVSVFADNYQSLYHLTGQLVAFEPDISDKRWNAETLQTLFQNIKKIILFMQNTSRPQAKDLLLALKGRYFHLRSQCSGGKSSFHISAIGKIYPCILATEDEEYEFGNVTTGIDAEKLSKFDEINSKDTKDCEGCAFYQNCESKSCKVVNKYYSGSYNTPSAVKCHIQNLMYQLVMEFRYLWEENENDDKQ